MGGSGIVGIEQCASASCVTTSSRATASSEQDNSFNRSLLRSSHGALLPKLGESSSSHSDSSFGQQSLHQVFHLDLLGEWDDKVLVHGHNGIDVDLCMSTIRAF